MSHSFSMADIMQLLVVSGNIQRYEEEMMRSTGEKFNLFEILRIGHYEVQTHSPILAELLNPIGTHGQGAVFLKLFLDEVGIADFDPTSAVVQTEVGIGELGRIDIAITDRVGQRIIIENKIYAGLQDRQLQRYREYAPTAHLVYLTLNGEKPADNGETQDLNLLCISYRQNIIKWLAECQQKVALVPVVREAITHYTYLLKRLTNQNTNARMNEELLQAILKDEKSFLAFSHLCRTEQLVKQKLIMDLNEKIYSEIPEGCRVICSFAGEKKSKGFLLTNSELEAENLAFGLHFEGDNYQRCIYGFVKRDNKQPINELCDRLRDEFKNEFGVVKSTAYWPAWYWWEPQTWTDDVFHQIRFGTIADEVSKTINRLANVSKRALSNADNSGKLSSLETPMA